MALNRFTKSLFDYTSFSLTFEEVVYQLASRVIL